MGELILIMLVAGFFGGLINYLQTYESKNENKLLFWKCIIIGIGASFLVPLFLQTISSAIITSCEQNSKDYLVFGGFCLIASIFSKRFIETLGDKILQKAKDAEKKAEELKVEVEKQSNEVDSIIAKSTESDDESSEEEEEEEESKIINSLREKSKPESQIEKTKNLLALIQALKNNNYTFRTVKGIAKEIGLSEIETLEILNVCRTRGLIREINNNNKRLYALTQEGINFDKKISAYNNVKENKVEEKVEEKKQE